MRSNKIKISLVLSTLVAVFVIAQLSSNFFGGNVSAIQGAIDVPFPIYLENNGSVAGVQVEVSYPQELTLDSVETTSRMPNATLVVNDLQGLVKVAALVNDENSQVSPGVGEILNLFFDVSPNASTGLNVVSLENVVVADIKTIPGENNLLNGSFKIVEPYNITFLPPVSNFENFTLQEGATLPLKFTVTNETGFVSDDSVLVRIYNGSLGIDHTYNASGEGDDYVNIDVSGEKYQANIHTIELSIPLGSYIIEVTFSQFQKGTTGFELVQQGPTNGKGKGKQIR